MLRVSPILTTSPDRGCTCAATIRPASASRRTVESSPSPHAAAVSAMLAAAPAAARRRPRRDAQKRLMSPVAAHLDPTVHGPKLRAVTARGRGPRRLRSRPPHRSAQPGTRWPYGKPVSAGTATRAPTRGPIRVRPNKRTPHRDDRQGASGHAAHVLIGRLPRAQAAFPAPSTLLDL